jgi:hypothetical protein
MELFVTHNISLQATYLRRVAARPRRHRTGAGPRPSHVAPRVDVPARDPLRLLAARLLAAWGWYLPAARWLASRIALRRELAADRAVARLGALAGRVMLLIAQMLSDLLIQRGLDHGLGQLLQQPVRAGQ